MEHGIKIRLFKYFRVQFLTVHFKILVSSNLNIVSSTPVIINRSNVHVINFRCRNSYWYLNIVKTNTNQIFKNILSYQFIASNYLVV